MDTVNPTVQDVENAPRFPRLRRFATKETAITIVMVAAIVYAATKVGDKLEDALDPETADLTSTDDPNA